MEDGSPITDGGRLKTQNDQTVGERWSNDGQSREGNPQRLISLKRARRMPSYRRGASYTGKERGHHGASDLGTPWRPQCL